MKILIAYDGSESADKGIDDLQRAALPMEADALVVSVAEVWLPPPPPRDEVLEDLFRFKFLLASNERARVQRRLQNMRRIWQPAVANV
jgi:hypothetical protein